jgi:UDP-glucose 4-epimerase
MDLANGHILALDAMDKPDGVFSKCTAHDGNFRAFNLGKGKGMSVLDMINAMAKATGFKYEYEIVGRR